MKKMFAEEKKEHLLSINELEQLKKIFDYIDPRKDSQLSPDAQKSRKDMTDYLAMLNICRQITGVYQHKSYPHLAKVGVRDIVQKFIHLLRECMVTHQWPEVLKLVQALIDENDQKANKAIYHAGMAGLLQVEEDGSSLVDQFVRQIYHLQKVIPIEVLFDYLLYLMHNGNLEKAKDLMQELKSNKLNNNLKKQLNTERRCHTHSLFYAYQGMILYFEWKQLIEKDDYDEGAASLSQSSFLEISQMMSQGMSSQVARATADNAVELMKDVMNLAGIWDVFISPVIEIYRYYDLDGKEMLETYRDNNPLNPNAHRYLYEFQTLNGLPMEDQISSLQDLIRLDPSSPLALTLGQKLAETDPLRVAVIFDYLDFDHCCQDVEAWSHLADLLKQSLEENNVLVVHEIKKCWDLRKDWWPYTRFDADTDNLVLKKYIKKVKKMLKSLG